MSIYKWYVDIYSLVLVVLIWAHYVNIVILFRYRIFHIGYGNLSLVCHYINGILT